MKIHRFYIGERKERAVQNFGDERCWVQDSELLHQWRNVLRFRVGDDLSLFDGFIEILYKIAELKNDEVALHKVTELMPKKTKQHTLLAWSLLKKDKNDWVLQKATELGVTHFVPLVSDRSEKTGFNLDRATKIIIEASEQCGRIDIPKIDDVQSLDLVVRSYKNSYQLYACRESSDVSSLELHDNIGILIGPEGGWTEKEVKYFESESISSLTLGQLTLRAETAALVAATKILGIAP